MVPCNTPYALTSSSKENCHRACRIMKLLMISQKAIQIEKSQFLHPRIAGSSSWWTQGSHRWCCWPSAGGTPTRWAGDHRPADPPLPSSSSSSFKPGNREWLTSRDTLEIPREIGIPFAFTCEISFHPRREEKKKTNNSGTNFSYQQRTRSKGTLDKKVGTFFFSPRALEGAFPICQNFGIPLLWAH